MEQKRIITFTIGISLLLIFAFYSSTMNYVYAVDVFVFTFTTANVAGQDLQGIRGVTYRDANNRWYVTAVNDTIGVLNGDTLVQETGFSTLAGGGSCTQPNHILALKDFNYLAYTCDEGTQFNTASSPYTVLNNTGDFSGGNYVGLIEWQTGDRLLMFTYQNEILISINLDCVNAVCTSGQKESFIDLSASCTTATTILDIEIDEVRDYLWIVCGSQVVVYDLPTATVIGSTTIVASLSSITYNAVSDRMILTGSAVGSSDIYVVNAQTFALLNTVAFNRQCDLSASNTFVDTVYIGCEENDTVYLFDVSDLATKSAISVLNIDLTPLTTGGTNIIPAMFYSNEQETVCLAHNNPDSVASATENYITCIVDVSGLGGEDPQSEICELHPERLICQLGGDGTLGSAGAFVIGNTTAGTGILGIGCSIGLVDCTEDDNPQTNGLGLLIFIASIFVVVGMFFRSLGAEATFHMPVYLWVMIILSLSAFFTITGLIDPVFLILGVVAMVALASPKILSVFKGGSFGSGGGGSTE